MRQNFFKFFTIVFIAAIFSTNLLGQSMANYSFTAGAGASLVDMSTGTTTIVTSGNDDTPSGLFDIGFTFVYMGVPYTQFSASPDGFLKFGAPAATSQFNNSLTSTTNVPKLAPYWDDLASGTNGYVRYKTIGSAPNRQLVVEWFVTVPRNTTGPATATYQAVMYEATGAVEFIYGAVPTGTASYSVGMNSSATQFASVTVSTGTVSYVTANNAMTDAIPAGTIYTFTPPATAPAAPTNLTFTDIGPAGMTLNWTDNSSNESGFSIYRSLDGIAYTFVANVAADVITYAATGLTPGTTYYWRVQAFNEAFLSSFLSGSQITNPPGTLSSVQSGNWNDPNTWGGSVPSVTDNATITAGHTVTLDATGLVCLNLTVNGELVYQATPLAGITVGGSVTVGAGGSFNAGTGSLTTHTLGIGGTNTALTTGSIINNGTLDLFTTAGVTTTFFGSLDGSISGSGAITDFYAITVNKGTTRTGATLDVVVPITMSNVTTSTVRLNLTNGTFKLSSASTLQPAGGTQTIIAAGGRLWLNHPGASYNGGTGGSPTIAGELRIDEGTFNYGVGNNTMTITTTGGGGAIVMNGGTLNMFGAINFSSGTGVVFNMAGGNINVDPQVGANNLGTGTTLFSIGASCVVNWSGGIITIVDPHAAAGGTAWSNAFGAGKNITGGTLRLGDGVSTASGGTLSTTSGFGISNGHGGEFTLEVNNRTDVNTSRMVRILANSWFDGLVDVKENGYVFLGSGATGFLMLCLGDVINNGTIAGTIPGGTTFLGTFYFQGPLPQVVSGSGSFVNIATVSVGKSAAKMNRAIDLDKYINDKFEHLSIEAAFGLAGGSEFSNSVTFNTVNPLVTNRVNAFEGTIIPNGKLEIGREGFIPVVQLGSGAESPSGTFSTVPLFNNVFGPSTYLYSIALGAHVMGSYNEMPAGPQTLTQLFINDADGLTLDRAITVTTTITFQLGNITTTSANLLTYLPITAITPSATSYVAGPFARQLPASLVAGSTYNFPIGKSALRTFALVDPITTADGPVFVTAEVFDANSGGTAGTGMLSLNTNRYWSANVTSGVANLTSTKVRLTEDPLNTTDGIAKSATVNGIYNLVSSNVPAGGTITTDDMASLSFFNIGTRFTGPIDPTGVSATVISGTQINLAFTPNGANNNVVIVWNTTGTFSAPSGAPVVGEPLAGGTVLSNGTASPVNHTGLNNTTTYYYKAFSYDGAEYSIGVEVNATTPYGLPYFQDFNAGLTLPAGWTATSFSVLANHGTSATNGLTRNFWSSATTGNARTPFVGAVAANTVLEFDYRIVDFSSYPTIATVLGAGNTFNFQVSTDNTNWTTIHTIDNSNHVTSLNFAHVSLSLSAYAGSIIYVRVTGQWASGDYYFDIDNVYIGGPPVANPGSLSASAVSTTQIDLSFTTNPSNQNVVIVWNNTGTFGTPSGTPPAVGQPFAGGTMLFNGTASPVNHTGLTPITTYYYRAFSYDGVDFSTGVSANATTLSPPISTYPFVETFEAVSPTRPAWSQIQELGTGSWTYAAGSSGGSITTAYEGALNARFVSASPSGGGTPVTKLVSPILDLSSLSNPRVTFWYGQEVWFGDQNELKVYYRISPTDPWVQIAHYTANVSAWTEEALLLPNKSAAYQFAFEGINNFGRANVVDLVTVEEGPSFVDAEAVSIERPNLTEDLDAVFNPSVTIKNNSLTSQDIPVFAEIWSVPAGFRFKQNEKPQFEMIELNQPASKVEYLNITEAEKEKGFEKPFSGYKTLNHERGTESAELLDEDFSGTFPPTGWTTVQTNTGSTSGNPAFWSQYSTIYNSAPYSAGLWWFDGALQNEWLITPSIPLTGSPTGGYYLKYNYYGFRGSVQGDHYYTKISTDGGTTWTVLADLSAQSGGWNYWETPAEINLNAYAGETVKIAWQAIDGDGLGLWYIWLIDDVEIGYGPSLVYQDNLIMSGVGSGTSVSANFASWTATPAGNYRFEVYTNLSGDMLPANDFLSRNFIVEGSATFQLSVDIAAGWNMVSVPGLHPTDQNVNTWWAGKDPSAGVFRFAGGYQAVTTVAPGTGYWMKHVGANTYNTGDEWPAGGILIVPNDPIPAVTGWNLIGGYHNTVATAGITTTPVGLISGQVFGYIPGSGYAAVTNLTPGYGYWIKLTGAGDINLPTNLAKSAPVSEYIKSDWGRIILTDAAGKSYILYSVDGEVDLTQYELPPLPPAGMFDVRYGSQRLAEVIGSEIQTIEMQGIEYPVTVRVEGMTIRLQDETGKIVNQVIKSGEDVVISNPQVGKLKVSGNVIPETYSLEQNYPNPFNPSTTIEFSIPEDVENLKLTIYDALGQKVAELVNGKLEAGRYSYQWDASKLASGLYIYQLQTNKFTSTKKMMMLK